MKEQHARTCLLIGEEAQAKLTRSHVALFGLGGVGGGVLEGLARSGVGELTLVDNDTVSVSNLNRQLLSTWDSIGRLKTDAAEERVHAIDPDIRVHKYPMFFLPENEDVIDFGCFDYVVDAIDTVTAKLRIIELCHQAGVPVISAMGCGNRLDPSRLVVTDIYSTSQDPLARIMRRELKKRGIPSLKVVYSTEPVTIPSNRPKAGASDTAPPRTLPDGRLTGGSGEVLEPAESAPRRRDTPGSTAFVPPVAGFIAASEVVRDLIGKK